MQYYTSIIHPPLLPPFFPQSAQVFISVIVEMLEKKKEDPQPGKISLTEAETWWKLRLIFP